MQSLKVQKGPKLEEIQRRLREQKIDGWLLYDHHGSNKFVHQLLGIPEECVLTRRFFYWIPQKGEPEKILHQIEAAGLDFLPGEVRLYLSWTDLEAVLKQVLHKAKTVAMEYSPRNKNPYVSLVDAGTIEEIRALGIDIVSSANLLQYFTSVLDEKQIASHREAAAILEKTVHRAWDLIAERLRSSQPITEYDVQQFILSEFMAHGCITEDGPCCAVDDNSALPHYMATRAQRRTIERGDFILLDLWCKKEGASNVYADITRVAVAATEPTPRQQEIFTIVRKAQQAAIDLVQQAIKTKKVLTGAAVDDVCRQVIVEHGYGERFPHRTGHNIDTSVHGGGAHLDNLETSDQRQILPGTCLSIEPGIYLPGEFGIRLEYNLLIGHDRNVEITGGTEEAIICLL